MQADTPAPALTANEERALTALLSRSSARSDDAVVAWRLKGAGHPLGLGLRIAHGLVTARERQGVTRV